MDRGLVSKTSIVIHAPAAKVWDALVNPNTIKQYFFGAETETNWNEGSPIVFKGAYQGNEYEEKGVLLQVKPQRLLQYTHWSHFDGLTDAPENYRVWTFGLAEDGSEIQLSISEDNIPTEKQRARSDEFWTGVLATIKQLVEV